MSGGRATISMGTVRQSGDVAAIAADGFPFVDTYFLELKFYRDLLWDRFLLERSGPLALFWSTAVAEAAKYWKRPVLIARQNRYPTMLITTTPLRWPFNCTLPILQGYHNGDYCVIDFERMLRSKPGVT